jgi:hypothetical protein
MLEDDFEKIQKIIIIKKAKANPKLTLGTA